MATNKRIKGDYVITSVGTGDRVIVNTPRLTLNGDQEIFGSLETTGNIVSQNYVVADFFVGDGSFLSNVNVSNVSISSTRIANGTSNVNIPVVNGNITFGVNGTGDIIIVSSTGANITTGATSNSNVTGALVVSGGVGVTGNIYADAVYSNNEAVLTVDSVISGGTY